jgi:hypothetical protein
MKEFRLSIVTKLKRGSVIAAASLFVITVSGCALFGPKVETTSYETEDGAVIVESVKFSATVKAIDEGERTLTLDPKYGQKEVIQVSPEMANFNQIRVGDVVHAEVIEALAVELIPGGSAESIGEAQAVALAPLGAKPGALTVSSREVTADIIGIDQHAHSVMLEFIDGSTESVKVGKHVDLTLISLDDSVRITVTDAVAIDIAPQPSD